jgi:cysteine-rich repeat protein
MTSRRFFKLVAIMSVLFCTGIFLAHPVLAADAIDQSALATFAADAGFAVGPSIQVIIARLIRTVISFLGIVTVALILYGGFMYMTAGGVEDRVKKAKRILTNAVIGLLIVLGSFTITQFVLNNLLGAGSGASGDITQFCQQNPGDPSCQDYCALHPGQVPKCKDKGKGEFTLNPPTSIIQCAAGIRNLKLKFVFTKSLDAASVAGMTVKQSGVDVPGKFVVSGKKVTFTPTETCPGDDKMNCFPVGTFHVSVDPILVKSTSGDKLVCAATNGVNPCSFDFTTGAAVDTQPPSEVSISAPFAGQKIVQGALPEPLQARTKDDAGVSTVDFFVENENEVLFSADLTNSSTGSLVGALAENLFNTNASQWNSNGYATNKAYPVWAEGSDCAGNVKTSSKVSVMLRAANCGNATQDAAAPYGETGINCGGDPKSEFYCGLCKEAKCTSNAQCSSGNCVIPKGGTEGTCQNLLMIKSVSPDNGAVGSLVTISGSGFGTTPGTVDFLGTGLSGAIKTANAYQCLGKTSWSENEIVVQIPDGAIDGPIRVNIPASGAGANVIPAQEDRTDDLTGPVMTKFDVNMIKRPGLCSLVENSGTADTTFKLNGLGFGATKGSSLIYLSNFEAKSTDWKDTVLTATIPNTESGAYQVQVFAGDYYCLNASGQKTNTTCFTDDECVAAKLSKCATSWCSENTQIYCDSSVACGKDGGKCVDVRVGSNTRLFTLTQKQDGVAKPVINTVDPATKIGPGQYITIKGSGFGASSVGSGVKFTDQNGNYANGDFLSFPEACKKDFWRTDAIIVKVPSVYADLNPAQKLKDLDYKLTVTTQSGTSNEFTLHIYPDVVPGPSICSVTPKSGKIGTPVVITGEYFGAPNKVIFNQNQSANPASWQTELISVLVPAGAKTGAVSLGNGSNSVNFAVGSCNSDPKIACGEGETCCANGSCTAAGVACPDVKQAAHFAYKVSTSPIPVAPKVVENCSNLTLAHPSPSPSALWTPNREDICVNAVVTASFDKPMIESTLKDPNNIFVQKCESETAGKCTKWSDARLAGSLEGGVDSFKFTPAQKFEPNTQYQVTVKGSSLPSGGVKASATALTSSISLLNDYIWDFRTATSSEDCGVNGVVVSPGSFVANEPGKPVNYLANLVSKSNNCVIISCVGKSIGWESDKWNATFLPADGISVDPPKMGVCSASVNPRYDTQVNNPAKITAKVVNEPAQPSGFGLLTISSTEPKIIGRFPDCSTACPNVKPWVKFSVPMMESAFGNVPAALASVSLIKCSTPECSKAGTDVTAQIVAGLEYKTVEADGAGDHRAYLNFKDGAKLDLNTSYRIVLGQAGYFSKYLKSLFPNGSNYSLTDPSNTFYSGTYSWKFRTKATDAGCGVDHVEILPKSSVLSYIGQRQEFYGTPYGSPDECSAIGQALQEEKASWNPWTATDDPDKAPPASGDVSKVTAFMLKSGSDVAGEFKLSSKLPDYCSGNCLWTGTSSAICGNGKVEKGEACDGGDGCSKTCLKNGTAAPVCGNGKVDAGEECDDGLLNSNDGCSASCLKEGSFIYGSVCGNSVKDENAATKGGESCDDGNKGSGDGCSALCLLEGSKASSGGSSICGNGSLEAGEQCDDTNTTNGDGCSSVCLKEGTNVCSNAKTDLNCCGNGGKPEAGETCEDGNTKNGDGCSSSCLKEGSSLKYKEPSYCGDGDIDKNSEECDATPVSMATALTRGYGVGEIAVGAPLEVDEKTGYAISKIQASVTGQAKPPASSSLSLYCSCESDNQCGTDPKDATKSLGCGASKCCYQRPSIVTSAPGNVQNTCRNTSVSVTFSEEMDSKSFGASVDVNSNGTIEPGEVDPNIQLQLINWKTDSNKDGKITQADATVAVNAGNCPYYTKPVALEKVKTLIVRALNWIKTIFGQPVFADATKNCYVPLTYEQDLVSHKVYLRYNKALEPLATYQLKVKTKGAKSNGVLNKNQVGVCLGDDGKNCSSESRVESFVTGSDVCLLDIVNVTDQGINDPKLPAYESKSPGYYSRKDESHTFVSESLTYRKNTGTTEEIQSIPGMYAWDWKWISPVKDTSTQQELLSVVAQVPAQTNQSVQFKADGKNGQGDVIATATITTDTLTSPSTGPDNICSNNLKKSCKVAADCGATATCDPKPASAVSGRVTETVFLCENPWPSIESGVPFKDLDNGTSTNFSMFYCRDAGDAGRCVGGAKPGIKCEKAETCEGKNGAPNGACVSYKQDDLRALTNPPTVSTPASSAINSNVLKEYVFNVIGTKDSIGVRVMKNEKYLSPMAWFKSQGFTASPKATKLDGYEAVQTGTTMYVAATNKNGAGVDSKIYSNIYVISYNEDAGKDAQEIFNLVLQNFRFNANDEVGTGVSHVGLCLKQGGGYATEGDKFISCSADSDCVDIRKPDGTCSISGTIVSENEPCPFVSGSCDADKQKLARDLKRVTDMTSMVAAFEKYGNANGVCAVTKSQKCVVNQNAQAAPKKNPACPGTETCVPNYPMVQSGTFIPSMSNSMWPSWNSTLGNALSSALPSDPLNQFAGQCQKSGYDSATCWNGKEGKFQCPTNSHIYTYRAIGGDSYALQMQLEYKGVPWVKKISAEGTHAVIELFSGVDAGLSGLSDKWSANASYDANICNDTVFGNTTICGDGVKSSGEKCEKGEKLSPVECVMTVCTAGSPEKIGQACTAAADCGSNGACAPKNGKINVACKNDCTIQSTAEAVSAGALCKPEVCGNGIKDPNEICDDGVLNGTYGHCDKNCSLTDAVACGDGTLAGSEQCDCGTPANFSSVKAKSGTWANLNCTVANGVYLANGLNCSAECKLSGPKCGDKIVNGATEACDGGSDSYAGKFCVGDSASCATDDDCGGDINSCVANKCLLLTKKCVKDSDCGGAVGSCGGAAADPNNSCVKSAICVSGKVGKMCTSDAQCEGGKCSTPHCSGGLKNGIACTTDADCTGGKCSPEVKYDLTRNRSCSNACTWGSGWSACQGGTQQCGNGALEGTEECDDGNTSNNDSCTNVCKKNICSDGYVNVGIESCDNGGGNKKDSDTVKCSAGYGGSCNYCTNTCQYKTQTGEFCGDGIKNGDEYCDGKKVSELPYQCFKADQAASEVQGSCEAKDEGKQGSCGAGYTCRLVGVCNGGSRYAENGKLCTPYVGGLPTGGDNINNCDGYCSNVAPNTGFGCNHDEDCNPVGTAKDKLVNKCLSYGSCLPPVCAENCGSTCPTSFKKVSVQVQGNLPNAEKKGSIDLYSMGGKSTPDRAAITFPACRAGAGLTADILTSLPLNELALATTIIAPTMKDASGKYIQQETKTSNVLDIGNGIKIPLPGGFICHDTEFSTPFFAEFKGPGTVNFKNLEFTYCPL